MSEYLNSKINPLSGSGAGQVNDVPDFLLYQPNNAATTGSADASQGNQSGEAAVPFRPDMVNLSHEAMGMTGFDRNQQDFSGDFSGGNSSGRSQDIYSASHGQEFSSSASHDSANSGGTGWLGGVVSSLKDGFSSFFGLGGSRNAQSGFSPSGMGNFPGSFGVFGASPQAR